MKSAHAFCCSSSMFVSNPRASLSMDCSALCKSLLRSEKVVCSAQVSIRCYICTRYQQSDSDGIGIGQTLSID